jgi:uncharacterized protein with von Willebrand factor type A (vWA) domain
MDNNILNSVSQYLFSDLSGQDLFKSLYRVESIGSYTGRAKELLDLSIEAIPKYAYESTTFAYSMATKLLPRFVEYIEYEENKRSNTPKRKPQPKKSPHQALQEAMSQTKDQLGIEESIDGMKRQDELLGEIESQGEQQVWGLLSTKNPDAECISEQIKRVAVSIKSVQKSLKNISAVAESLLKGIEKVKSEYSDFGFDYGRNLQQIDPSELAYLQGDARQLFLLKYAKGDLLEESSQDKKGLGDLIIAVDTSGSTCGRSTGDTTILDLEMGIALTLAKIATKHRCKVRVCLHHTKVHGDSQWMKGRDAINKYFADIYVTNKCVASGDNDFDEVLGCLCGWMEDRQYTSKRKPGIVFITDGHDSLESSTLERVSQLKSKSGIKLYSYFVAASDPRNHAKELIGVSEKSYWIDAKKPIENQIEAFEDISV